MSATKTIKIAICDDEITDLTGEKDLIEDVLSKHFSDCIEWDIDTYISAEEMVNTENQYNMVFLDIEMSELAGIEIAASLRKRSPHILIFFVTHHENYMDEALNKHAFRFWTKPIDRTRLIYGIRSAITEIESHKKYIAVTSGSQKVKIFFDDIIYIYHSGRFTYVVSTAGKTKTYDTFRSVIRQLTGDFFAETHASCYVNMNYVVDYSKKEIKCEHNGKIYLPYISARKYTIFKKRFKEWSCDLK